MATAADIIATMRTAIGKPYVFGAEGPDAFDCSGLMQWAFGKNGITLPRIAADQAKVGTEVPRSSIQPGDMIFSIWDGASVPSHVALYIGNNQYLNAPQEGENVKIGTLNDYYWQHVKAVRRVNGVTGGGTIGAFNPLNPLDLGGAAGSLLGGAVDTLAKKLFWFAMPTSIVRLAAGGAGVVFLLMGIVLLARQAKQ
jgi:hypothetical protein